MDRKCQELESVLSEPHKQTLRLAGLAAGNKAAWEDRTSTVVWRDTSARAFAATLTRWGRSRRCWVFPRLSCGPVSPGCQR